MFSLSSLIILIAIFVIVLIALSFVNKAKGGSGDEKLYKQKALLTANEIEFFNRLTQALPDHYIFPQVSLGALLQPNVSGKDRKKFHSIRGTFAQKISDFVICTRDIKVIAIVELDDKTHNSEKDAKRDAMIEQAGYRVIRWNSKTKPTLDEIRQRIEMPSFPADTNQ
ncbi:DUF2726 domain-containing protein [Aeromonas sp. 23P]|uniref:DUF2726 domain-containing protein n=1 Tax=Aeromonas sp. 23P TaxID=3452716 RepID=UPI003F79AD42